jgi:hypothetical protein
VAQGLVNLVDDLMDDRLRGLLAEGERDPLPDRAA